MICINKNCRACKDHFTNQTVYKECYSDKEFITDCDAHNTFEELIKTNLLRARARDKECK